MYEVYAFCRAVDDIADDGGPNADRIAMLESLARRISRASMPEEAQRAYRRTCQAGASLRFAARGFLRHHRRHGDGCAA